jgi:CHAT domain-containing protein
MLNGGIGMCQEVPSPASKSYPANYNSYFNTAEDSSRASVLLSTAAESASSDSALVDIGVAYDLIVANVGQNDHPLLDSCYMLRANKYLQSAKAASGLESIDSAIAMSVRLYPDGHTDLIVQYNLRSQYRQAGNDLRGAVQDLSEAIGWINALNQQNNPVYVECYLNAGVFNMLSGNTSATDTLLQRAVELQRLAPSSPSPDFAEMLFSVAGYFDANHKFDISQPYLFEALVIYRNDSSVTADIVARCAHRLAKSYFLSGRFAAADSMFKEAEALYRSFHALSPDVLTNFMMDKATVYRDFGKFDEAERLLFEVYDSELDADSKDKKILLRVLHGLNNFYMARGMHSEAEPLLMDAMELEKELYGKTSLQYGTSLHNLGIFYLKRGRYNDALSSLNGACAILDTSTHPAANLAVVAIAFKVGLATTYHELGLTERADSLFNVVIDIATKALSETDAKLITPLYLLASLYIEEGRYEEAGVILGRAEKIIRTIYQGPHLDAAKVINQMARYNAGIGKASEADKLFRESLGMRKELLSSAHPYLLVSLRNYAEFLAEQDRAEEARDLYDELMNGIFDRLNESFEFEGEGNQLEFMTNIIQPNLASFSRFCVGAGAKIDGIASSYLNVLLRLKGAITNESARRRAELAKNERVIALNHDLTQLREQQAALASRHGNKELNAERRRIRQLANQLDATLRKLDTEYDKLSRRREASWRDVQRTLKSDEALVEYAAIPDTDKKATLNRKYRYAAVVLRASGPPIIVRICSEQQLKPYFAIAISPMGHDSYITSPAIAKRLYDLVWKPLEQALKDVSKVYISSDGMFHRLSFAALNLGSDSVLYLDNVLQIHYLSGGGQLLNRDRRFRPKTLRKSETFVMIGDPDFSAVLEPKPAADSHVRYRGGWESLPGTQNEIKAIARACASNDVPSEVIIGGMAKEDTVKALSGTPPRVLHLATHGYFFPEVELERTALDRVRSGRGGMSQLRVIKNPLLRSGLVFSGANAVWTGASPASHSNDGILTALEVSRLNLVGTELVTLSACETALGDVKNGEGIFGLQRAFQVAGASAVMMSLWKVADEPTAKMMELFYQHWIDGESKAEAFRKARKIIRNDYPSPYIWAAFVLVGE